MLRAPRVLRPLAPGDARRLRAPGPFVAPAAVAGLAACAASAASAACSSTPGATVQIVSEADTFSTDPVPVLLQVQAVDASGTSRSLASAKLPASSVDLGSLDVTAVDSLVVTGLDAAGDRVLFGESIPALLGALSGTTLPLFVQRTGALARLPNPLSDARTSPVLAVIGARYLLAAGGDDPALGASAQLYDFAGLAPVPSPVRLPIAPRSAVFVGTVGWLIGDAGATKFNLAGTDPGSEVTPPAGGSFADVAGGQTVFGGDGSQYVVGATRTTGPPTATVLAVDAGGKPSWVFLGAARLGAAATWVTGRGLVVMGGSATAPGAEIVAAGATAGSPLAYPPDPSVGTGAAPLDGQHVLLAGGTTSSLTGAGVRTLDLACAAACTATSWADLPGSLALAPAMVFASDGAHAVVVGDGADGATHVVTLSATSATEIAPRVAHEHARAVVSPIGSVVLYGGDGAIESYVPP